MVPRPLPELAIAMAEPIGHQAADALLIEALQSLIYRRTLNPQQRDAVQKLLDAYSLVGLDELSHEEKRNSHHNRKLTLHEATDTVIELFEGK